MQVFMNFLRGFYKHNALSEIAPNLNGKTQNSLNSECYECPWSNSCYGKTQNSFNS